MEIKDVANAKDDSKSKLKVWFDGNIMNYYDATVPILTHSLQYGSGIFEGIRSYETEEGVAIFRLYDHVKRFFNTAKIYSMSLHYTESEISKAIIEIVKENGPARFYIRPFAFYNDDNIGVNTKGKNVSVFIAAVPFGSYFDKRNGIRCKVASWHRINSSILPVEAKASGNYLNSIIATNEAKAAGFDEAIMTSSDGLLAEGAAENIFLVENGILVTPSKSSSILLGITRDSVIKIARAMKIKVVERSVHREELYTADEVFFAGTAAEITPIIEADGIKVGNGSIGKITRSISERYDNIVHGKEKEYYDWLTFVK